MCFPWLNVYVACSLTHAPPHFTVKIEELKSLLRSFCNVLCFLDTKTTTDRQRIYRYDIHGCVGAAHLVVAVCDFPSIGIGMEIQRAIDHNKSVLAVGIDNALVTQMILDLGEPDFEFRRYTDLLVDVPPMVQEELAAIDATEVGEIARLCWRKARIYVEPLLADIT